MRVFRWLIGVLLTCAAVARANEPVAGYLFPAGAQRGTQCALRVGGLFLHEGCGLELTPGLRATGPLKRVPTIWFEGPLVPLPDSQLAEDYPRDFATQVEIAPDAPLGAGYARLSTSQGVTALRRFIVGDLPEIVEEEIDGEPIPVDVKLPVTINGRIFPREDVDVWSFGARRGQTVWAEVCAARLGSPLEARLELTDASGRKLAEAIGNPAREASLSFQAPADGTYQLRIHDINFGGLQTYVYRLSVSSGPRVTSIFPLGGRRGTATRFEISGDGVASAAVEVTLPSTSGSTYAHRFDIGGQQTPEVLVELSDLSEQLEREPNNDAARAEAVALGSVVNGRIQSPGDRDSFAVALGKDETIECDLQAARLGSPLDAVLVIADASGKELLRLDDMAPGNTDAQCRFTPPADGSYIVSIAERLPSRGSPAYAYRLRIERARDDFALRLAADAFNLVRGGEAKLRVDVESIAPVEVPIDLEFEGLPPGVTATPTQIPAKARQVELKFATPEKTPVATGRLVVRGTARVGQQTITRTAAASVRRGDPPVEHAAWAVAIATPFKFAGTYRISFDPRGGFVNKHYRLSRGGYSGPLEIQLADHQLRHLQGIRADDVQVPPGGDEFDFRVYLPPWMELGRTSRSVPMAVGTIEDFDGSRHVVSFATVEQNEQVVVRVSSELLSLALDRPSILARPGAADTLSVRLAREPSQRSPVTLELIVPAHVRGVRAEPVVLAEGENSATISIDYAADCGPFNMPLVVRATSASAERPAVAEARLEIVAGR